MLKAVIYHYTLAHELILEVLDTASRWDSSLWGVSNHEIEARSGSVHGPVVLDPSVVFLSSGGSCGVIHAVRDSREDVLGLTLVLVDSYNLVDYDCLHDPEHLRSSVQGPLRFGVIQPCLLYLRLMV